MKAWSYCFCTKCICDAVNTEGPCHFTSPECRYLKLPHFVAWLRKWHLKLPILCSFTTFEQPFHTNHEASSYSNCLRENWQSAKVRRMHPSKTEKNTVLRSMLHFVVAPSLGYLDFHPINLGQIQNTSSINYSLTRLVTRLQIYLRKPSKSHGPNWGNPRIARKEETRHTWMVLSTQGISMKLTTTHKYLLKDHFQNFTLPRKLFKEPLIHECEIKSKGLTNLLKQDIYKQ